MTDNLKGSALVILAEGAEEMEAVITTDVLRRGKVKTVIGGLTGSDPVSCSRSVVVKPDMSLEDAIKQGPFDAVILPGGLGGTQNLAQSICCVDFMHVFSHFIPELHACGAPWSAKVKEILQEQEKSGKIIGAICAAPSALHTHGIGKGKTVTSHPCVKDKLDGYVYSEERVVRDGNLVTSRGPGTAFEFGIELVRAVRGDDGEAEKLAAPMLLK